MATCQESISLIGVENIPIINPNTTTPWFATGLENTLLRIESMNSQTITFNVSTSTTPVSVAFTLFKEGIDGSLSVMGSATVTNLTTSFSFEILSGTYVMCIRRGGFVNQSGTIIASFVSRPTFYTLPLPNYTGEYSSFEIYSVRPPRECHAPIFFELVDGELPPGIIIDDLGAVYGRLPVLDCLPDADVPSVGWYETVEGTNYPFGRVWRFKLKIRTATTKPEHEKEEWFCINIHNNWDIDTQHFVDKMPFQRVEEVKVIEEAPRLADSLCVPCVSTPDPSKFTPKPLTDSNCPACSDPKQNVKVDLIEIPLEMCECPVEQHLTWYWDNRGKTFDSPYVQDFMDRLDRSAAFKILLSKAGFIEEENPNEFAIVNTFDNFLQISVIEPEIDPNSYSALVDQWRVIQNQNLPMVFTSRVGETCEEYNS